MNFCSKCGKKLKDGTCPKCKPAVDVSTPPPPSPEKSKTQTPLSPPPPPPPPNYSQQQPGYSPPGQQYPYPPPGYVYPPREKGFIVDIYYKTFNFIFNKPILLWGLSLLYTLMVMLALIFGVVPLIWLPIILVLELGAASIFLTGYRGGEISSMQLFQGFSKKFFRNAGGMGWRNLWTVIWSLIPFAGIVLGIIKYYSYRFVPYIMLGDPDIHATEAIKKSMKQTHGYKGKMFLADLLVILATIVVLAFIFLVARIPFIGAFVSLITGLALFALLPLVFGVLGAAYYDKVITENPDRE